MGEQFMKQISQAQQVKKPVGETAKRRKSQTPAG